MRAGIQGPRAIPALDATAAQDGIVVRDETGTRGATAEPDVTAAARILKPAQDATQARCGIQEPGAIPAQAATVVQDAPGIRGVTAEPGATPDDPLELRWVVLPADCIRREELSHWRRYPQERDGAPVPGAEERLRSADARCWP